MNLSNFGRDLHAFKTQLIHTGLPKPQVRCDICGKSFAYNQFNAHFDAHTWWQRTFWPITEWWHKRKTRRLQKGRS